MALFKENRQEDGVTTNYHRILYVTITTNRQNSIAVVSYVDIDSRNSESTVSPYKRAVTYETDYDETMTIKKAYEYLKTRPEFEGATDI